MKKIPINAIKKIADKYNQDQIIIIGWSNEHKTTYVTTYGKTSQDCDQACQGGNWLKRNFLDWPESECLIEPARINKLKKQIQDLEQTIKIINDESIAL